MTLPLHLAPVPPAPPPGTAAARPPLAPRHDTASPLSVQRACEGVLAAWWKLRQVMAATPYNVRTQPMTSAYQLAPEDWHLRVGHSSQRVWGLAWPPEGKEDQTLFHRLNDLRVVLDREGAANTWTPTAYTQDPHVKQPALAVVELVTHLRNTTWHSVSRERMPEMPASSAWGGWDLDPAQQDAPPTRDGLPHDLLRWAPWMLQELGSELEDVVQPLRDHLAARFMATTADHRWFLAHRGRLMASEELTRLVRHRAATPEQWKNLLGRGPRFEIYHHVVEAVTTGYQEPRTGKRVGSSVTHSADRLDWLLEEVAQQSAEAHRQAAGRGLARVLTRLDTRDLDRAVLALETGAPDVVPVLLKKQLVRRRLGMPTVRRLFLSPHREVRETALRLLGDSAQRQAVAAPTAERVPEDGIPARDEATVHDDPSIRPRR